MTLNPFKPRKSESEMVEDTERLKAEDENMEVKLSIAKKRVMIAALKERGLTPKHFGFDWGKILQWLKTH